MAIPPRHILSKSTFLYGSQCPKRLYLHKFRPELKEEITAQQQAVFDRGTEVGTLARELFPGGVDASPSSPFEYQKSVIKTKAFIEAGEKIIYEAVFQYEGVLAAIDILVRERGHWKAYEVKSSTEVKEVHITDAALQYHVITSSGIALADISIVLLNNEYIRKGKIKIKELFQFQSVKDMVVPMQEEINDKIVELKKMLAKKAEPEVSIGPHCSDPYTCDFIGHCWKHIPEPSIFDISGMRSVKKFEHYENGIIHFKDLNGEVKLNSYQQLQVECYLNKKSRIDKGGIRAFLVALSYPLFFMDFETFQLAVPIYDITRPYQQIPFQFSLHYQKSAKAPLQHFEFLADGKSDPRIPFVENLLEFTSSPGMILTYNMSFEVSILNGIARDFPKYGRKIEKLNERVRDLMIPFKQGLYYTPSMKGSYSIKSVLPALVPELSYEALEIGEGAGASLAFQEMLFNPAADKEKLRKALLEYCKLDTLAMVEIHKKLVKVI